MNEGAASARMGGAEGQRARHRPLILRDLKFSDVMIPLLDPDWSIDRAPTLQKLYLPERNRSVFNQVVPPHLCTDIMRMREKITREHNVEKKIKAFFEYDGVRYRLSSVDDDMRGPFVSCRRIVSPLPPLSKIKGLGGVGVTTLLAAIAGERRKRDDKRGLILFVGPSGSGKTTTMFSVLEEVLKTKGGIAYTVENPPEIPFSRFFGEDNRGNCYQIDAGKTSMAEELAEVRRRTNQYVLAGEIQYSQEAKEAVLAALDGSIVVASCHGNSIIGALERLLALLSDAGDRASALTNLSTALSAVILQENGRFEGGGDWVFDSTMLFVEPEGSSIPGVIASGVLAGLQDTIQQQNHRMSRGGSPFQPLALQRTRS